jgi:hypothetical protein
LFLSNLLYQSTKWNIELVGLKIDLSRAYARISHFHLGRALDAAGIDASLSAALLTELCFLEPAVCVRGVGTSQAFPMHRGLPEGSPASGALLGILLQGVFQDLVDPWKKRGLLFALPAEDPPPLQLPLARPAISGLWPG